MIFQHFRRCFCLLTREMKSTSGREGNDSASPRRNGGKQAPLVFVEQLYGLCSTLFQVPRTGVTLRFPLLSITGRTHSTIPATFHYELSWNLGMTPLFLIAFYKNKARVHLYMSLTRAPTDARGIVDSSRPCSFASSSHHFLTRLTFFQYRKCSAERNRIAAGISPRTER